MNELSYERPREKLRQRGVQALNLAELLQVVLGSGTRGYSVAKLAREVAALIQAANAAVTYETLVGIKGLGAAKATQLLAAIELAQRLNVNKSSAVASARTELLGVGSMSRKTVRYCLLDGASRVLLEQDCAILKSEHYGKVVRRMFSHALAKGAHSVVFSIGSREQAMTPSAYDLGVINAASETGKALQIYVPYALLVNAKNHIVMLGSHNHEK